MNDNPFAEPDDDSTRIIVRPSFACPPSSSAIRPPSIEPAPADIALAAAPASFDLALPATSVVVGAAGPLLSLLARLHNVASMPDAAGLRARAMLEIRGYEQALRDGRVPIEQIRPAHYALCASLDDVVQSTPWGSHGSWADASLVATFHQEVRSGERFFDLLSTLCRSPAKVLPVIELMYLCMSLGMRGRTRLSPRGPAELDRIREETYLVILRTRGACERALSPHWLGVSAPYRPMRLELPVWLTALAAAGLLGLCYALLSLGLNADSDRTFAEALALPPASMPLIARSAPATPLPPTPPASGDRTRLASLLASDIRSGAIGLVGTEAAPIIRLPSTALFASGSASLDAGSVPVLQRVAEALRAGSGPVRVIGYTDSQPVHTIAFPSNYQLSLARARAAGRLLAQTLGDGRITEEGRADADPIGSNATAAGRRQNRRIDIAVGEGESAP